jgi:hypothetical protein
MIHHYITVYGENGRVYAESWMQLDIFGRCFCFWNRKMDITDEDMEFLKGSKDDPEGTSRGIGMATAEAIELKVDARTLGELQANFLNSH